MLLDQCPIWMVHYKVSLIDSSITYFATSISMGMRRLSRSLLPTQLLTTITYDLAKNSLATMIFGHRGWHLLWRDDPRASVDIHFFIVIKFVGSTGVIDWHSLLVEALLAFSYCRNHDFYSWGISYYAASGLQLLLLELMCSSWMSQHS